MDDSTKPITYLQIKTHQLAGYFLHLERKKVFDGNLGGGSSDDDYKTCHKYIPHKLNIKFHNTYYNDIGTNSDSKVTDKKEVLYEYSMYPNDYGKINEIRWNDGNNRDKFIMGNTGMVDNTTFHIIFYNIETKIREILKINKILDQRKIDKKTTDKHLSFSDRLILKRNDEHLIKLKRTYLKELVGICKEHLFLDEDKSKNTEELEIIEENMINN
jgi:hypothetical protein